MLPRIVEPPLCLNFGVFFQLSVCFDLLDFVLYEYLVRFVDEDRIDPFVLHVGTNCSKIEIHPPIVLQRSQDVDESKRKKTSIAFLKSSGQ